MSKKNTEDDSAATAGSLPADCPTGCELGPQTAAARVKSAYDLRFKAEEFYRTVPAPAQICNGDEEKYKHERFYASYTKGLEHDKYGLVVPGKYCRLLKALKSGVSKNFFDIKLGCFAVKEPCSAKDDSPNEMRVAPEVHTVSPTDKQLKLVDPQAGLAFDTEGIDSRQLAIPPAYAFSSEGNIGEIAENYWLALCRDVAFADYGTGSGTDYDAGIKGSITAAAAADLSKYAVFDGPKDSGTNKVTVETLFRGNSRGDREGPYLSQFLLWDIPYGSQIINAGLSFALPDTNYMITPCDWLAVQSGCMPPEAPVKLSRPRPIYRGRDLAQYVHIDELFQAYLNACLLLITPKSRGGFDAVTDAGNPYNGFLSAPRKTKETNQMGFGTLGEPNFKTIVAEVATRALKAVWFQKWFVHRRLRPEVYGGRIHYHLKGKRAYDFNAPEFKKLQDTVLPAVLAKNTAQEKGGDSYLLPMAFPEGSPLHPAYGAGHATVAGACITILKALFQEELSFSDLQITPKMPGVNGGPPIDYPGDAAKLTINGELNKLAANIGLARNFAGVHWRSDYTASLFLGEQVALYFLQEYIQTYNEDVSFSVKKFNGVTTVVIKKGEPFRRF